ncbi:TPA: hypothetical protein N1273_004936 [Salmonella enterica]|nr:hypothetical protein [Salmonella enterica]
MFNFFKKLFSKTIDSTIYIDSDNYRSMIIELNLNNPNEIIAKNVDHKIISIYYNDIVRISIIVDGSDYLPQPRWTVQTAKDVIHISNDLTNADKLFFEILNIKLDGYSSDETQQKILEAQACVGDGFFHIWQRSDADEIFKSID